MEIILAFLFFTFGLIVGSFINALSFRYNSGKSMLTRSMCFACGHKLNYLDLVPFLSYLGLRGRCRYCRSKISIQYPLVELITGATFLFLAYRLPLGNFISLEYCLAALFWSSFIFLTIYDIKHQIVPDEAVYSMMLIGIAFTYLSRGTVFFQLEMALLLFLPFLLIWLLSKGRWMGLGDGKLILAIGLFMPIATAVSGVILAFWLGSLFAFLAIAARKLRLNLKFKQLTMKSELPFVPFLFVGSALSYIFSLDLLSLSIW